MQLVSFLDSPDAMGVPTSLASFTWSAASPAPDAARAIVAEGGGYDIALRRDEVTVRVCIVVVKHVSVITAVMK